MDAKTEEQVRKMIREIIEELMEERARAEGVTLEEYVARMRAEGR